MTSARNLLAVTLLAVILGTMLSVGGATPTVRAGKAPAGAGANARLQMYEAVVDGATAAKLVDQGFDVVQTEQVKGGVRVVLVLYPWQKNEVAKLGVDLELWTNTEGVTATKLAAQQKAAGFKVWRHYDGPERHPRLPRPDCCRQPGPAQARGDRADLGHRPRGRRAGYAA